MRKPWPAILGWLLLAGVLFADFGELERQKSINWDEGAVLLEVRVALDPKAPLAPDTRYQAESRIDEALPGLFIDSVQEIPVDSFWTIGQRIRESDELYRTLSELAVSGAQKQAASFSKDIHQVRVLYRFPFFGPGGLATPFVTHTRPFPIRRILGFTPSRTFTGLVIYAKGQHPAYGKSGKERINPALLPKLYDEDMNLVLSPEMCDPEFLARWGVAAYTYSSAEAPYRERIGELPLQTMARGVFGKNSTDILLPVEAARRLLSREGNHRLLREGRILIIIDRPAQP